MRKTGMGLALLGAFAGAVLLAGCDDQGRSWAQNSQQGDYSPNVRDTQVRLHRGSNTGFPRHIPLVSGDQPAPGTGGAGLIVVIPPSQFELEQQERQTLWLRQDERVPYPPPSFDAEAAISLGTGKPLRTGPNGAWIQGTHAVELGSGLARSVAPTSTDYQPEERTETGQVPPRSPP